MTEPPNPTAVRQHGTQVLQPRAIPSRQPPIRGIALLPDARDSDLSQLGDESIWPRRSGGAHIGIVRMRTQPITWSAAPPRAAARRTKRLVDLIGTCVAGLLLAPVLAACALAVKLGSKGPVLFRQTRVGRHGRDFACYKFRTMHVGAAALQEQLRAQSVQDGPAFKIPGDVRVTTVGRLLRKFSLDELPQLFNVLRGDMSLVGPRPPLPTEVALYTQIQRRRISVTPGLTCIWQVWGRNKVSFRRWVEMDLWYIDHWSLWLDLKLIAHTFRAVVQGTGM